MDYKFNNHKERLSINPSGLETEGGSKYYLSYEKNGKIKNVEIKSGYKVYQSLFKFL